MKLTIYSPERRLFASKEINYVIVNGDEGQIEILPGHAYMLGQLEPGAFEYKLSDSGEIEKGFITYGFFETTHEEVTLLAEVLEYSSEINVERAKTAQLKAESALNESFLEEAQFNKYKLKLQRALIRQQIANR